MTSEDETYRLLKKAPFETVAAMVRSRPLPGFTTPPLEEALAEFYWTLDEYMNEEYRRVTVLLDELRARRMPATT
jgi:hypothetical protein